MDDLQLKCLKEDFPFSFDMVKFDALLQTDVTDDEYWVIHEKYWAAEKLHTAHVAKYEAQLESIHAQWGYQVSMDIEDNAWTTWQEIGGATSGLDDQIRYAFVVTMYCTECARELYYGSKWNEDARYNRECNIAANSELDIA